MDKRYLEALSNVAFSMHLLVDTLQSQVDSMESNSAFNERLANEWNHLNTSLLTLQESLNDTKEKTIEINDKQDKILKMLKTQSERQEGMNLFGEKASPTYKKNLKDGISTIVLMAGSIMALGLAFKVVGQVDFASVVALSISLPLVAHAIAKMAETELDPKKMAMIGLTIVGMSIAIAASSYFLTYTQPVSAEQLITIVAIAATFAIVGWSVNYMAKSIKNLKPADLLFIPLVMLTMSAAILGASYILPYVHPMTIEQMFNVVTVAIAIALSTAVMALPIAFLNKVLDFKSALMGSALVLIVSAAILGSSWILSFGNYTNYPPLDWALGVGLSIVGFGLGALALGTAIVATGGIGALAIAAGIGAIAGIAGGIIAADKILSSNSGGWSNYPSEEWAKGVGGAIAAFAPVFKSMIASQAISILTGGKYTGDDFANTITSISKALVASSHIFTEGNWSAGFPTQEWARNVSYAIAEFNTVYKAMDSGGIMGFFGANDSDDIQEMIVSMARTMVLADKLFSGSSWGNYPSKEWVNNMSYAIAKFTDNWKMLADTDDIDELEDATGTVLKMAKAYDKLATSMKKLGAALKGMDKDGVKHVKHITENVLAMSVIDEDKFEDLLEILNDNSSGLGKFAASLTQKISAVTTALTNTSNQISETEDTPSLLLGEIKGDNDKSISDLWDQLEELKGIIAAMLDNSNSINTNVEEIANKDENIGLEY